eukprot:UN24746
MKYRMSILKRCYKMFLTKSLHTLMLLQCNRTQLLTKNLLVMKTFND